MTASHLFLVLISFARRLVFRHLWIPSHCHYRRSNAIRLLLLCISNPNLLNVRDCEAHLTPQQTSASNRTFQLTFKFLGLSCKNRLLLDGEADVLADKEEEDFYRYLRVLTNTIGNRKLLATDTGYIGQAVSSAEEGDEIFVILGCGSLMVLRPVDDQVYGRRYKIAGCCFVCGIEDGEAVLGPLPQGVVSLQAFRQGGLGHIPWFVNKYTGEGQLEDPRLAPLLGDEVLRYWRRLLAENPSSCSGLRLSYNELRSIGIDVQKIKLV